MCAECRQTPCHHACPNNDEEDVVITYCHLCDEPIYEGGEDYYILDDATYCSGCVSDGRRRP